jgi:hypothetical protein
VARVPRRGALLAEHDGGPRLAGVELGGQLGRHLARHPAELLAAAVAVHGDRVLVVRVRKVAPQLERPARLGGLRGERGGMVPRGPRHADDPQAPPRQLGRLAREISTRLRIDGLIAREPDLTALVRVPVALVVANRHLHRSEATT